MRKQTSMSASAEDVAAELEDDEEEGVEHDEAREEEEAAT